MESGEPEQALALFERILAYAAETGDFSRRAQALAGQAECLGSIGRLEEAELVAEAAEEAARRSGRRRDLASALSARAKVAMNSGKVGAAREFSRQAQGVFEDIGDESALEEARSLTAFVEGPR